MANIIHFSKLIPTIKMFFNVEDPPQRSSKKKGDLCQFQTTYTAVCGNSLEYLRF